MKIHDPAPDIARHTLLGGLKATLRDKDFSTADLGKWD